MELLGRRVPRTGGRRNWSELMLRSRWLALFVTAFAASSTSATPVAGQDPDLDDLQRLLSVRQDVDRLGGTAGAELWPGFRPDTIPVIYVLPERGTLLLNWEGPLPEGYAPVRGASNAGWIAAADRGAASTGTRLDGRQAAQVVVRDQERPWLVGTTIHEAFHVFEGAVARPGGRFGRGENSFLVTRYPIFDVKNETAFALEGHLLAAALDAETDSVARALAQRFLAVREARHRDLGPELAEFEQQAELNEGLAQYAGVKGLRLVSEMPAVDWHEAAAAEARRQLGDLEGFLDEAETSFRRRYYSTGAAQALLLDRFAGSAWKARLMEEDRTLQDMLALETGYRERELELRRSARERFDALALSAAAEESIEALRRRLRARVDSAMSRPGITLVVETDAIGGMGLCGIDPQNLLQVDEGVLFHSRWVRPCAGAALQAELSTPTLQDQGAGTLRAVIGPADEIDFTVDGEKVDLAAPHALDAVGQIRLETLDAMLSSARADVEYSDGVLRIRPLGS